MDEIGGMLLCCNVLAGFECVGEDGGVGGVEERRPEEGTCKEDKYCMRCGVDVFEFVCR